MKDKFKEHSCNMKNEAECEEELEEASLEFDDADKEHFDDEREEK